MTRFVSLKEVCSLLYISRAAARRLMEDGTLKRVLKPFDPHRIHFLREDIEQLMEMPWEYIPPTKKSKESQPVQPE